jgi:hypothetical protein
MRLDEGPGVGAVGEPASPEVRTIRSGRASGTVVACSMDDTMLSVMSVNTVFFFERTLDPARLADGLVQALDRVPVFGGTLRTRDGALEIVCDDIGVPMTTVDLDDTLPMAVSRMPVPGAGFVDQVDAWNARDGGVPLLSIRLNQLAGGGTALGCSFSHAIGDMSSFMVFMRAWSAAVEGAAPPDVPVVTDRDAYVDGMLPREDSGRPSIWLPDAEQAEQRGQDFAVAFAPDANGTVHLYFTEAEVARMREEFGAAAGRKLSTNDVFCAHLVGTIRALDDEDDGRTERLLTLVVNLRRRFDIPVEVIGNLLGHIHLWCPPRGAPELVAADIRAAVDDFARTHLSYRANRVFLDSVGRDRLPELAPRGFDPARRAYVYSDWRGFGAYDIAFDGQRPVYFSQTGDLQLPWGAWTSEGIGGAGYLSVVCLPAKLAERLTEPEGRAAMHRFREPSESLPDLVAAVPAIG